MNLNDLLSRKDIAPKQVLVLRHRPWEPELNKVLPWLAAEKPDVFNAYQQTQGEKVERAMTRAGYVAAFIGREPGKALFVGLYSIKGSKPITRKQFWQIPANVELKSFGMKGFTEESPRSSILWFDLVLTDFYAHWKGKLIVGWPGIERSWHRWAHIPKNEMPVLAVLDESALDAAMPEWNQIDLTWEELGVLPTRWKVAISQWRAIYYTFDTSDGKGYVGSAYGGNNLLGRWKNYAARGHGGNRLLRQRDPKYFRFTILERVSPDMDKGDVIRLEATWKDRLHTRAPFGLNDN
ncbi:MAG: GIY-YIG nuclease family protein [Planctomycetes bacterium]|nr:GIY-YIG nuclease family protein [Planctomycetota bacterium]MCG2683914.1 GIY-YIG nuclease family protein [Planctomycetales bacterium]